MIHCEVWDEILYPFPNFSGAAVEVLEWRSNSSHILLDTLYVLLSSRDDVFKLGLI